MTGGAGDDTYVAGLGDTINEITGSGVDTVQSNDSFTLNSASVSDAVENLVLLGGPTSMASAMPWPTRWPAMPGTTASTGTPGPTSCAGAAATTTTW